MDCSQEILMNKQVKQSLEKNMWKTIQKDGVGWECDIFSVSSHCLSFFLFFFLSFLPYILFCFVCGFLGCLFCFILFCFVFLIFLSIYCSLFWVFYTWQPLFKISVLSNVKFILFRSSLNLLQSKTVCLFKKILS